MGSVTYRANAAAMRQLLEDRNGPVQLHVANKGREVEGIARRLVGRRSGKLASTIQSGVVSALGGGYNTEVTAGGPEAPYAEFHHEGTPPHVIVVKSKKVLANKESSAVFGQRVNHPGTRANPFLIDAMRQAGLSPRRR